MAQLPPEDGDAPLAELGRDALSVLLYLAFTDEELQEICKRLKLSVPGFRLDKMSGVQKADYLADEIRLDAAARKPVLELLRKIYEFPALDDVELTAPVAERIAVAAAEEDFRVRLFWRVLADPQPDVRKAAHGALEALAGAYYGGGPEPEPAYAPPPVSKEERDRELERAQTVAEKSEAKIETLSAQLKSERQEHAATAKELSAARKSAERAANEIAQLKTRLEKTKEKKKGAPSEKQEREVQYLRERVEKLEAREAELEGKLAESAKAPVVPQMPAEEAREEEGVEDAPAEWAMPRFTEEFYESLEGWDVRLQRAAFKQAYLLTENWRHPSLRALALEGLPEYYRVRVATDVRLIYRRSPEGLLEIRALIDREDLDRYVRQAKTR
jgi:hypothetical protein